VARRAAAPEPEPRARRLSTGEEATPALLDGALAPLLTLVLATVRGWLLAALAADTAPQVPRTVANATSPVMMIFLN
jgi:hypothetical protein